MRLGVLGGTFDPIHYAHLFIAEAARARFALDTVLFVPNAVPPHKSRHVAPAGDRHQMVCLAIAPNPRFACSRIELDRPGRSYTVDTLAALHREYQEAEIYFITGTDALAEIGTWRNPEQVARQCWLVAVERDGWPAADLATVLTPSIASRVRALPRVPLAISSTDIRRRVREGDPIRYLTPDPVVDHIASRRLYLP